MDSTKLVVMANQVAQAFRLQTNPAALAADHFRAFWTPVMRQRLLAHLAAGGEGLEPLAKDAARVLSDAPST